LGFGVDFISMLRRTIGELGSDSNRCRTRSVHTPSS
jgi:hypothetical protein